jgi:histidine triad (HIT) family protein
MVKFLIKPTFGTAGKGLARIMHNHEPKDYVCPFCRIVQEARSRLRSTAWATDVIHQTDTATAFLGLGRWPRNPVDVLVVPNAHIENLYDLPLHYAPGLHHLTRAVALALKALYQCDGISTRQHNEPAGDQDVWHYHVHVTPRYRDDQFYRSHKIRFPEAERLNEARRLRDYIQNHTSLTPHDPHAP